MRVLIAAAVAFTSACSARAQQPALVEQTSGGIPRLPADGDRGYVADSRGLVEIAPTGDTQVLARAPISWCVTDAKARVVWFINGLGLSVFDLDDRKLYPVILDDITGIAVMIDHGAQQRLEPAPGYPIAAVIVVRDSPKLRSAEGCTDPTVFQCYDQHGNTAPELLRLRDRVRDLDLADADYVASLAARGATGTLWARGPQPTIPAGEPDPTRVSCGWASGLSTEVMPSTWTVVVIVAVHVNVNVRPDRDRPRGRSRGAHVRSATTTSDVHAATITGPPTTTGSAD